MAKAAARRRSRRPAGEGQDASLASRLVTECVGLGLVAAALLSSLALATYSPSDAVFQMVPVANGAGVVGASMAGSLFGGLGYGAVVLVAAIAWLGVRLLVGVGLPGPTSRFWVGAVLLLVSVAALPPVLASLGVEWVRASDGGRLGAALSSAQVLLLSRAGAVLVNGFLVVVGVLSLTGISLGAALRAVARAAGWVGHWTLVGLRALGRGANFVLQRSIVLLAAGGAGLVAGA
ncbi:MAG: DNA translocase FtsK 4TM domain-containing protein, partial [Proteobacteria bacterium]|nr:DNA translocase FtsK 4TM domain-containing protein [Pseudomonadota bacterium]